MVFSLRNAIVTVSFVASTLSIPTSEFALSKSPSFHDQIPSHCTESSFQRIRNAIVEKIWPGYSDHRNKYTRPGQSVPAKFQRKYGNDVVLRFPIRNEGDARAFYDATDALFLDVWDSSSNWSDVRIAKDTLPSFLSLLPDSMQTSYQPLMRDLAMTIFDTYPPASNHYSQSCRSEAITRAGISELFFDDYQPLSVLYPWLRLLHSLYPHLTNLTTIGLSAEGREIQALRIGSRAKIPIGDPVHTVLIVAGSHAREWISVSTAAYIAYDLLTRYGTPENALVTKFLDHYDIVFVPVLNPDGYEYTWTTDRLWRKSRQPTELPFCAGIDLDRAFPFHWDGHADIDNPCMESYAGKEPLEAVEAKVLSEWAKNVTERDNVYFASYLDLHSYSQKILYPYSWTCHYDPPNLEDLEEVALGLAKNFRITTGHFYGVQSACEGSVTYSSDRGSSKSKKSRLASGGTSGGSSLDYFYAEHNIKYAYQIKLRDTGSYGFLLPKENIIPSGRETVEAVIGLGRWLLGDRGIESKTAVEDVGDSDNAHDLPEPNDEKLGQSASTEVNETGEDEWERVYDPEFELRRRR